MIRPLKQVFNDFIAFLKSPDEESVPEKSSGSKLKHIGLLYLIEMPVIVLFIITLGIIEHYKLIDTGEHMGEELLKYSYATILLLAVIAGPLIEEVIFRLPLKYRRNYLIRWIVWCISITGLVNKDQLQQGAQRLWKASYAYFFYSMAIIFGLIHLTNFTNAKSIILLAPFLTMTQLFGGLIIGYIRVKIGFIWGYTYHAAHNLLWLSLAIFFISSSTFTVYHYKDNKATIEIIRSEQLHASEQGLTSSKVTPLEIQYQQYSIKEIIASLTCSNEKYLLTNGVLFRYHYDITTTFSGNQSKTDSSRNVVLSHLQKAFGLKIERKKLNKEAWELYISDSTKLQADTTQNELLEVNGSLKYLGACLDRKYDNKFIFSTDTVHHTMMNIPTYVRFKDLPAYLENKYGLGLRRVDKEIEFINIDLSETEEERMVI